MAKDLKVGPGHQAGVDIGPVIRNDSKLIKKMSTFNERLFFEFM
jgi:hypothetical protein